jgi:hypothetical protein
MMIVGKAGEATGSAYITKHRRLAERVTVQRQLAGARGRFCPTLASPAIRWAAPAGIGGRANTVYQTGTSRLPICDVGGSEDRDPNQTWLYVHLLLTLSLVTCVIKPGAGLVQLRFARDLPNRVLGPDLAVHDEER